jgi:hypothetical protein
MIGADATRDASMPAGIDKSALAVPAPRRYRDRGHLRYVARHPAWSAAASRPTPITCGSCSRGPLGDLEDRVTGIIRRG